MTNFKNDVIIGSLFMVGIFGFISGEFILSTVLFATAAIFSNMFLSRKLLG